MALGARQKTSPVSFDRSTRKDVGVTMSSGKAGVVHPVTYIPLLRGDSSSGRIGIDVNLAEMPRPLLNGVMLNAQAWFVPKSAHPQFSGRDELDHSYTGEQISTLGAANRTPPSWFTVTTDGATIATLDGSAFFRSLGIHIAAGQPVQVDLIDAFNLIYNFRLAAHSSKLARKQYFSENVANAIALPRAFWPSGRFSRVVPDYERALIVGNLDLDVLAGQIPIPAVKRYGNTIVGSVNANVTSDSTGVSIGAVNGIRLNLTASGQEVIAEMQGQTVTTTLADIDKARTTQAFAKLRAAYAGNDATGFDNDDAIVALLMQGISVPEDQFKRPWLLDSKRVIFGMSERFATDGTNLDKSVSQGYASTMLSLNVPAQDVSGVIIVTVEVLPERIHERQSDEWMHLDAVAKLPNALRDIQRPEPVDIVPNRRVDARHATPNGVYGYEPMNDVWNREFTRLGGKFYQANPAAPFTEQRAAIWQAATVNPTFTADHYLAPSPFPHYVFSDTAGDAFELVARHSVAIAGLTQIGDVLHEDNNDYDAVAEV